MFFSHFFFDRVLDNCPTLKEFYINFIFRFHPQQAPFFHHHMSARTKCFICVPYLPRVSFYFQIQCGVLTSSSSTSSRSSQRRFRKRRVQGRMALFIISAFSQKWCSSALETNTFSFQAVQGGRAACAKPPFDFISRVPLWPCQARPCQNGTFVLESIEGFAQAALSPCTKGEVIPIFSGVGT